MNIAAAPSRQKHIDYRPDIDGLRAVAVIAVVLYHGWPNYLPGGFIGVDIFFVISGYLITSIILSALEQDRFSILEFYARRVRRIFPALLLVLAATIGFGWFVLLPDEFKQIARHVTAGGLFVSNLLLWNEAGYFDNAGLTKPLLHLWSLGIEEQFYLLWPLMLWLMVKYKTGVLILLCTVFAGSFVANLALTSSDATAAFYSPATRFWELMTGGIGAYLHLRFRDWPGRWAQLGSIYGALLLVAGFAFIGTQDPFPGWRALLPVAGTFLLIMAGPRAFINRRLLSMRLVVGTGLISYPLYLWHWPLLSYGFIVHGGKPDFLVRAGLIAAAVLLAILTYRFLELPIRKAVVRGRVVRMLATGMAVTVLAGVLIHTGFIRERLRAPGAEIYLNALNDSDFPGAKLSPLRYGHSLFQKVDGRAPGVTVFLGDSVMEHYGPFIEHAISDQPGQFRSAVFATQGSCLPILHVIPLPKYKYVRCLAMVEDGYAFARRPEVEAVVVGAAWAGYFQDPDGGSLMFDDGVKLLDFLDPLAKEEAYRTLAETLKELKALGKQVFLLQQPPMGPSFDPRNMITGSRFDSIKPLTRIEPLKLDQFIADNAVSRNRVIEIARSAGAELIDPTTSLCKDNLCPVVGADGTPVYTDTMHMRPSYSRSAAQYLTQTISPRLAGQTRLHVLTAP
ncbi:acyltransferase family protein [Massilia oculi]|uniref:acyltransferase family protein n=1 Tax=Massilia oculi TaxID=945844 RepID=UPI0028B0B046|nr:acyltransferase family protein [Massilia oculi]